MPWLAAAVAVVVAASAGANWLNDWRGRPLHTPSQETVLAETPAAPWQKKLNDPTPDYKKPQRVTSLSKTRVPDRVTLRDSRKKKAWLWLQPPVLSSQRRVFKARNILSDEENFEEGKYGFGLSLSVMSKLMKKPSSFFPFGVVELAQTLPPTTFILA